MFVCAWLPNFALRVVSHRRVDSARPAALASVGAANPVILECSSDAVGDGVAPGMLVSRALGCCANLQVLDNDPESIAAAADVFVQRFEQIGAGVHPLEPGRVIFDIAPLERLMGGREAVLRNVCSVIRGGDLRLGVAPVAFVAEVAAREAPAGGWRMVEADQMVRVLAPRPVAELQSVAELGLDRRALELLNALGLSTLGALVGVGAGQLADRFGSHARRWVDFASGRDDRRLTARTIDVPIEADLQFPEAVGSSPVLERALRLLLERAVAHPRCQTHAPRAVVVVCHLATGGSHSVRRVLRVPMLDVARLALACEPALDDIPAPVERMVVQFDEMAVRSVDQQGLLETRGSMSYKGSADGGVALTGLHDPRVQAGLAQVQAAIGDDALLQVLDLEPWSRVPERHAALVPRHADADQVVSAPMGTTETPSAR